MREPRHPRSTDRPERTGTASSAPERAGAPAPRRALAGLEPGAPPELAARALAQLVAQAGSGAALARRMQRQYGNRYLQRVAESASAATPGGAVEPEIEESIQRARGGGQSLDPQVQTRMEAAFGADFGQVRVHTGAQADALNRSLSARAFTTGRDIFFRQGEYNPQSSGGEELLAHELTHVVQQGGGLQAKLVVSPADDPQEREADEVARAVVARVNQPAASADEQEAVALRRTPQLRAQRAGRIQRDLDNERAVRAEVARLTSVAPPRELTRELLTRVRLRNRILALRRRMLEIRRRHYICFPNGDCGYVGMVQTEYTAVQSRLMDQILDLQRQIAGGHREPLALEDVRLAVVDPLGEELGQAAALRIAESTYTFEPSEGETLEVETRWESVHEFPTPFADRPDQGLLYLFVAVTAPSDIQANNIAAAQTSRDAVAGNRAIYDPGRDVVEVVQVETIEAFVALVNARAALCRQRNLRVRQIEVYSHGGLDGPIFGGNRRQFGLAGAPALSALPRLPYTGDAVVFFRGCRVGAGRFLENFAAAQGVATYGFQGTTSFSTRPDRFYAWESGTPSYQLDFPGSETWSRVTGRHPAATPPRGYVPRRSVVQRAPATNGRIQRQEHPPEPALSTAERLTEANRRLRDAAFTRTLQSQLMTYYGAAAATTGDAVADAIWAGPLELAGVAPDALADRRERNQAVALRNTLRAWALRALVTLFRDTATGLAARRTEVETRVAERFRLQGSSDINDLTDDLWTGWLVFGPITSLSGAARNEATQAWRALRGEINSAINTYLRGAVSTAAVAAMNPAEKAAVKASVGRAPNYLNSAAEMDALTDSTLATTAGRPVPRTDAAWQGLRGRITALVLAAEAELIRENIAANWLQQFNEQVWGYARPLYLASLDKPIWAFYRDDIVAFTFLGHTIGKSSGVHRSVARALELVERSALRLAGVAATSLLPDRPQFFGFRFQPQEGDLLKKRQISYHGTGRAIDARARANPMFSDNVEQLVSVLGAEELYDLAISRQEETAVANQIRPLMDRRTALLAQLARLPAGDAGRAAVETELAGVEQSLATINQSPQVTSLRQQAADVHRRTEAAEAAFQTEWRTLTSGSGNAADVDTNALRLRVTAALTADRVLLAAVDAELSQADAAIAQMTGREQRAARRQAQAQRDQTRRSRRDPLAARIRRLESLLNVIAAPEQLAAARASAGRVRSATAARAGLLREAAEIARHGITDFPVWLVQAFAEQGWSWGASWHEPKDAMHFDYMGPVESVR
jgi:hypothetical protein